MTRIGVVAIGRNEGERLTRCLESLRSANAPVVYADSGSSDGSPARARALGARVVELDPARSFSAARGRNEGFARLMTEHPQLELVQFIDADCEIDPGWLEVARDFLAQHPDVAVVCGRRRERHPERSPYNQLADIEWNTPIGDARACGGDALMRVDALRAVGGYRDDVVAGEEPELCARLRRAGHRIVRIDAEMTVHDAAMTRLGQWWRRQVRCGHAYADLLLRLGADADPVWRQRVVSILCWALGLPVLALGLAAPTRGASLWLLLAYLVLGARIFRARRRRGDAPRLALLYALACSVGKFAELQGLATFALRRIGGATRIIEYKRA